MWSLACLASLGLLGSLVIGNEMKMQTIVVYPKSPHRRHETNQPENVIKRVVVYLKSPRRRRENSSYENASSLVVYTKTPRQRHEQEFKEPAQNGTQRDTIALKQPQWSRNPGRNHQFQRDTMGHDDAEATAMEPKSTSQPPILSKQAETPENKLCLGKKSWQLPRIIYEWA